MGLQDAGKPHYIGHRDRLRQRFRDGGADALPDYELLELVLFRAQPRRDTKPLAKAVVEAADRFFASRPVSDPLPLPSVSNPPPTAPPRPGPAAASKKA